MPYFPDARSSKVASPVCIQLVEGHHSVLIVLQPGIYLLRRRSPLSAISRITSRGPQVHPSARSGPARLASGQLQRALSVRSHSLTCVRCTFRREFRSSRKCLAISVACLPRERIPPHRTIASEKSEAESMFTHCLQGEKSGATPERAGDEYRSAHGLPLMAIASGSVGLR